MANPRSCGSINAEIARAKKRGRYKQKRAKSTYDPRREAFKARYEQNRASGLPHEIAVAKTLSGKTLNATSDDFLSTYEWRRVRMQALKAYGARCQCCGASPQSGATINVDHIKPRKLFPQLALSLDNLQVLCHECNHGKGNWDMTDWRREPETESNH
jgi:5-methylcytosine-specific restriction endonuclease McrA